MRIRIVSIRSGPSAFGFTLIELLTVIAIIGILAALLLSAITTAKARGQSAVCLNNLKQLQTAWLMYAHDHDDWMCPNRYTDTGTWESLRSLPGSWVIGNAQTDASLDNLKNGALFPYTKSVGIYHCPSDHSMTTSMPGVPRTRSYGLFGYLNALEPIPRSSDLYPILKYKLSEIVRPPPSKVLTFLDESDKTISCGVFWIDPLHRTITPAKQTWIEVPSDRHMQGGNLAYVDGHVEHHRWRFPKNLDFRAHVANADDLQDLRWLQDTFPGP